MISHARDRSVSSDLSAYGIYGLAYEHASLDGKAGVILEPTLEGQMSTMTRREFVQSTAKHAGVAGAVGLLSAGVMELRANPLGLPIGCQTWPVREMIAKDFPGTIKQLADAGFVTIELCSPVGYADSGFGGLAKYSGSQLRRILGDSGVTCVSSHFSIEE